MNGLKINTLNEEGYQLIDGLIKSKDITSIQQELKTLELSPNKGGIRNAEKKLSSVRKFIETDRLLNGARFYLKDKVKIVRVLLFNKSAENNWLVSWHQDKTVAVSNRFIADGWQNWTIKDGIHHVQPPIEILAQMLTFRIHLDDTDQKNGCLKVIPKSHLSGLLKHSQITEYVVLHSIVNCEAKAGSTLIMKPLILHSSSKAISNHSRQILHIEFSSYKLPKGISWA